MARKRVALAALVYATALLAAVLTPIAHLLNRLTVRLYVVWTYDLRLPLRTTPEDFGSALNVALFVPVGALLVLVLRRAWWVAAIAAVALSAAIELVQLHPALHRQASLGDVISNGAGGLLGAVAAARFGRREQAAP